MESKGYIKLKDQKGVLSLTYVHKENSFFSYYKRPEWMRTDLNEVKDVKDVNLEEVQFVFEIIEVYRMDGNSESLFRPNYR